MAEENDGLYALNVRNFILDPFIFWIFFTRLKCVAINKLNEKEEKAFRTKNQYCEFQYVPSGSSMHFVFVEK